MLISNTIARRYVLGRQGLWPGRRWTGKDDIALALHHIESVQMDPLNVIARSHDLALWGRVLDYRTRDLFDLLYADRALFEYGGNLRIYPMPERPYWGLTMRRHHGDGRWDDFAREHRALLRDVRAELRARGPLGNRDFTGGTRVNSYRGRRDSALALYCLWLGGEVMVHHRVGFDRVYDLTERLIPASSRRATSAAQAEAYFARKIFRARGWCTAREWARWMPFYTARPIDAPTAGRRLRKMISAGELVSVEIEGGRAPYYLLAADAALLAAVQDGEVPAAWRPLATTTEQEVVFLAPLDPVIAAGRAKALFGFEYLWEVYKPLAERRWGYYTLPILYGDQLVARLDPRLDRASHTLAINGFWLQDAAIAKETGFADALARGLARLGQFVSATTLDLSRVQPARLRNHLRTHLTDL